MSVFKTFFFILFLKIKICEVSLPYILDHLFGEDQRLQKIIGTHMNLSLNEGILIS